MSVYRIDGLSIDEVWKLGKRRMTQGFHGIGEITVLHVTNEKLGVRLDRLPNRHASIVKWSVEKDTWKSHAQVLASKAKLTIRP